MIRGINGKEPGLRRLARTCLVSRESGLYAPVETPSKKADDWRRLKWRGRHFASPEARPTKAYTDFFVRFGVRDGALMVEQATNYDGLSYLFFWTICQRLL